MIALSLGSSVGFRHHREERNSELTRRFLGSAHQQREAAHYLYRSQLFYRLSNDYLNRYRKAHNIENTIPTSPIVLTDSDVVSAKGLD
jgi:hypothetical protein